MQKDNNDLLKAANESDAFEETRFKRMIRPENTSADIRQQEGLLIRKALKNANIGQVELAEKLGLTASQVSQWLRKNDPRQCPDWAFVAAAAILKFDPSVHRPHLIAMRKNLNKSLGNENESNLRAEIARLFEELDRDSQVRVAGRIDQILEAKKR
jgi:transcriptional regulator with XRE-family HTH domain